MGLSFTTSLIAETWSLYSIGVICIAGRFASRWISEGSIFRLWAEEYIMLGVLAVYTTFCWSVPEIAIYGSNFLSPEASAALTPVGVQRAIYGSKVTMVLEATTLATLWGCKACLCVMFWRLTTNRYYEHLAVKCISVFCVCAYILIMVLWLSYWCRPIWGYWAVPVQDTQCASYFHHMIFAAAFNIFADLCLLAIPLRLLPRLQIRRKQKIALLCVLSLGVFNILAAILNRYFNFAHPDSLEYLRWYVGENSTAIWVVNIPALRPVLIKIGTLFGITSQTTTGGAGSNSRSHALQGTSGKGRASMFSNHHKEEFPTSESEENLATVEMTSWDLKNGLVPSDGAGANGAYTEIHGKKNMDEEHGAGIIRTVEVKQFSK